MGPEALAQVLRPLAALFPAASRPELLVGLEEGDDAAVYRLDDSRALVLTTDFFTPVVDDPYSYGAVAAANALSDVYAMGGTPVVALNVASFPSVLPPGMIAEILRGGGEKAKEAGCAVVGGHTVVGQEPLYGLAVVGLVDPGRMFLKSGVRPGDTLVLTKALGVGVITTALKKGIASPKALAAALASMTRLNSAAAHALSEHDVKACTDVTGFSILGHALDLARKSRVGLRLNAAAVPWLDGAEEAARSDAFPGGTKRNREAYGHEVQFAPGASEQLRKLLFSPETSGGLLAAVPADRAASCLRALLKAGERAAVIGQADPGVAPGTVRVE